MQIQKEIYLIRHGETEYNRMGIVQGSGIDAPLNEKGIKQADAFFKKYGHLEFDRIYTSLLQRSYQTIASFEAKGIPVEKHEGLNEICWGAFEMKRMNPHDRSYYYDLIASWNSGNISRPIEGGESPVDVAERQQPVIDLILSRTEEKKILICMHGRAMRVLLCRLLNKPLTEMETFPHNNAGLYHLFLLQDNSIELKKENCIAHLEQI
jgi:2,3-bisphosphoglycerate-dependent phosphoglycerate mutase